MFDIKDNLNKLPNEPGVYLMKDKDDNIIYIGKAVILKNRVKQYFNKQEKINRISSMISQIKSFEYIVTDTEDEALILELNLIKLHKPKYNVVFKDDKSYPYIKVDVKSDFPTISLTRKKLDDGSKYFGPYPSVLSAKQLIEVIKDKYMLRLCKPFRYRKKPCIYFQINKCDAPCIGNVSIKDYSIRMEEIFSLLQGNTKSLLKELKSDMEKFSNNKEYEKAADLRDKIVAIERISQKQKISNFSYNEIDAIGIQRDVLEICIEVFYVRESKLQDRKQYFLSNANSLSDKEILSSFLKQNYIKKKDLPTKIMIRHEIEDKEILERILSKEAGRKVEILSTKIGQNLRFVEMAEKNAKISLDNRNRRKINLLNELQEKLNLKKIPLRIEMYDVSNLSGSNTTSGMLVIEDGKIKKNLSRKFNLKNIKGQDDVFATKETLRKRIKHNLKGGIGLGDFPDLIIADGGINQINAIKEVLKEFDLKIAVAGLVKNEKHKTRSLLNDKYEEIEVSNPLNLFLTNMQDETHNLAINYHRKKRDELIQKSALDDINGIGEKRKQKLFKTFKSIENMQRASIDELMKVNGISEEIAVEIKSIEIDKNSK